MYGYIVVNQDELRGRELKEYRRFYCGLCHALKTRYGLLGQCSVNYDSTFLAVLLSSLYDQKTNRELKRCIVHPFLPQEFLENDAISYAADMNVVLTYLKCRDDWNDEQKIIRHCYGRLLGAGAKKLSETYEEKIRNIFRAMRQFTKNEGEARLAAAGRQQGKPFVSRKDNPGEVTVRKGSFGTKTPAETLDSLAAAFGAVMSEVFAYRHDEWEQTLREVGFHMGKYIYVLDAWDDFGKDKKKGNFNPLFAMERKIRETDIRECLQQESSTKRSRENVRNTEFGRQVSKILELTAADCAAAFERLPIVDDVEILRNILYSGMWTAFYKKEEQE